MVPNTSRNPTSAPGGLLRQEGLSSRVKDNDWEIVRDVLDTLLAIHGDVAGTPPGCRVRDVTTRRLSGSHGNARCGARSLS